MKKILFLFLLITNLMYAQAIPDRPTTTIYNGNLLFPVIEDSSGANIWRKLILDSLKSFLHSQYNLKYLDSLRQYIDSTNNYKIEPSGLNIPLDSGDVYLDSINIFTNYNKFDSVEVEYLNSYNKKIALPSYTILGGLPTPKNNGEIYVQETYDSLYIAVAYGWSPSAGPGSPLTGGDWGILATRSWASENAGGGQAIIDSMLSTPTLKLGLERWGVDSSWQAQLDANMQKIDTNTYYLDPITFRMSGDTIYIDMNALASAFGDSVMVKAYYDPANIQEQIVGLTATQSMTNKTVNGVTLSASGSAEQYLSANGTYSTPSGTGTGEANQGQNIGNGTGIYKEMDGIYLLLRTLLNGTGISILQGDSTITISLASNVAYPDSDNTFTGVNTFEGTSTFENIMNFGSSGILRFPEHVPSNNIGFYYSTNMSVARGELIAKGGMSPFAFADTFASKKWTRDNIKDAVITDHIQKGYETYGDNYYEVNGITTINATEKSFIRLYGLGTTTITNFTGGVEKQTLRIWVGSGAPVTIQDNANIQLAGSTNLTMTEGDVLDLMRINGVWYRTGGSNN